MQKPKCSVDGCDEAVAHRGLCSNHYRHQQRAANSRKCDHCDEPHRARGCCPKHYQRLLKTGDPLGVAYDIPRGFLAERFWSGVAVGADDECWEWQRRRSDFGHGSIKVDRREHGTHRVAWELAYGPIPDGLWVLHRCDNPPCCNPAHLFLGTRQDNIDDMMTKQRGRWRGLAGASNSQAKLTAGDVALIRQLITPRKLSYAEIARRFSVSDSTIRAIAKGKIWRQAH